MQLPVFASLHRSTLRVRGMGTCVCAPGVYECQEEGAVGTQPAGQAVGTESCAAVLINDLKLQ